MDSLQIVIQIATIVLLVSLTVLIACAVAILVGFLTRLQKILKMIDTVSEANDMVQDVKLKIVDFFSGDTNIFEKIRNLLTRLVYRK